MDPVKQLQKAVGADADGIIGKQTVRLVSRYYNLSPSQAAHFFGQIHVESAGFTVFEENLNYTTAQRLVQVFPKYFPTLYSAESYVGDPEQIANCVYSNRMGNGDKLSGEGWKYRGRGAIQITGKDNYSAFSRFLGSTEPLENPDCLSQNYAFLSAFWYFGYANLWEVAKHGVTNSIIEKVTKKVNGGTHGLDSRIKATMKYYSYVQNG